MRNYGMIFLKIDKSKYSIYIHYKDNKKLNYFEDHKIKSIKNTNLVRTIFS